MTEYYENGPEGMPRVERMTRSTIMAVLSQKDVPTIYVSREEDYNSLCKFAHAVAEETLARVPAWPVEHSLSAQDEVLTKIPRFNIDIDAGGDDIQEVPYPTGDFCRFEDVQALLAAAAPAPIQQEPVGYVSQSTTSLLMEYRGEGFKTSMRIYNHPEPEREITVPLYAEALAESQVQAAGDALDAARYRWLRDKARSVDWTRNLSPNSYTTACRNSANQMDTAIDAAMREQQT